MNFNVINLINSLWVERYRPRILDNLLCGEQVKDYCENARITQTIQNILLTGKPGCGKTTLAKIIVNDILKCDYLYINASDENGIDTIRIKIQQFVMTKSIDGRLKVAILDECLHEDTLIWCLRDGVYTKCKIRDIDEANDLVLSYNIKKQRIEWKPFVKIDKGLQDCYELEFDNNEKVICTGSHKWYVKVNNKITKMKLDDIIKNGIEYIYSPDEIEKIINTDDFSTPAH